MLLINEPVARHPLLSLSQLQHHGHQEAGNSKSQRWQAILLPEIPEICHSSHLVALKQGQFTPLIKFCLVSSCPH